MILYINAFSITKRAFSLLTFYSLCNCRSFRHTTHTRSHSSLNTFRREAAYTTDYFVRPPVRMYVRQKPYNYGPKKVAREEVGYRNASHLEI